MNKTATKEVRVVFAGRRLLEGGKLAITLVPLDEKGRLLERRLFKAPRSFPRMIGGIYLAQMSDNLDTIANLDSMKWSGDNFENETQVLEWDALDKQARLDYQQERLEKNTEAKNTIDRALISLRRLYHDKHDIYTRRAIESAVLSSLRTPPK